MYKALVVSGKWEKCFLIHHQENLYLQDHLKTTQGSDQVLSQGVITFVKQTLEDKLDRIVYLVVGT